MQEFNPARGGPSGPRPDETSSPLDNASLLLVNGLFRALGPDAAAAAMGAGRGSVLSAGQTLWSAGETAGLVCFPLSGLIAALAADLDGAAAQVQSIGVEGAAGLVEGLAGGPLAFEYRALVATEAWLVPVEALRALLQASPVSTGTVHRHIAQLFDQARVATACSARHSMRARLADCLLSYEEKTTLARLPMTQEMLSAALGANRTTVTALMINLSTAGLTRTGRGWVSIIDRERLDRLACGCRKAGQRRISGPPPEFA